MLPLDFLYLILIFFTTIIWTLLIIALIRLLKILNMATEIVDIYEKIKSLLSIYSKIPEIIKEKFSSDWEKEKK